MGEHNPILATTEAMIAFVLLLECSAAVVEVESLDGLGGSPLPRIPEGIGVTSPMEDVRLEVVVLDLVVISSIVPSTKGGHCTQCQWAYSPGQSIVDDDRCQVKIGSQVRNLNIVRS